MIASAYLAAEGFERELIAELGADVIEARDRLVLSSAPARHAAWAQNAWQEPERIAFGSIKEAATQLKARARNWAPYTTAYHRRAALIADALPPLKPKPIAFMAELPRAPMGGFTLLDEHTMLASARCSSPFGNGEIRFEEDSVGPPSRAYLKLWELFTLTRVHPNPGQRCIDVGAAPGGWTFVLASLGAKVVAVDKAALEPRVAAMPNVEVVAGSAFGLEPRSIGPVDWFFSDVVCYPARLLALVRRFLDAGTCPRFVCTIKLQGETDHDVVREFASIEGSHVQHLVHNKHELTWWKW